MWHASGSGRSDHQEYLLRLHTTGKSANSLMEMSYHIVLLFILLGSQTEHAPEDHGPEKGLHPISIASSRCASKKGGLHA